MGLDINMGGGDRSYTHNVTPMWRLAGVYDVLYMTGGTRVGDHIKTLKAGVTHMALNPVAYEELDPPNGWGEYRGALNFLLTVLHDAIKNPDAVVWISK